MPALDAAFGLEISRRGAMGRIVEAQEVEPAFGAELFEEGGLGPGHVGPEAAQEHHAGGRRLARRARGGCHGAP